MNQFIRVCIKTLGLEGNTTSHSEKYLSTIGAFIGMAGCYAITQYFVSPESSHLFMASMAASAVLLFAVPHGALSQPWPLIMGHTVSAIIGIYCYQSFDNTLFSTSLAVSLSVLIMYYLRCLHPPGAATAFFIVTSDAEVHTLGFDFIWLIIGANIFCLLIVAIVFNGFFHWRRYPVYLYQIQHPQRTNPTRLVFSQEDMAAALHHVNSFIDVTPEDLSTLFEYALQHAQKSQQPINKIESGKFYSNGLLGHDWQVFEVLSCEKGKVHTHTVAGKDNLQTHQVWRLKDFRKVVQQEVRAHGQHWVRKQSITANA